MAAEGRAVDERDVVAERAIVGDMGANHQEAIGADRCRHMAALGAGIDGDIFADRRFRADGEGARLVAILYVLRPLTDRGEGENFTPGPEPRAAPDRGMRMHFRALAELDIGSDHAKRADRDARPKFCAWIDHCGRMDVGHSRPASGLYDHGAHLGLGDEVALNKRLRPKAPDTPAVAHLLDAVMDGSARNPRTADPRRGDGHNIDERGGSELNVWTSRQRDGRADAACD